jgi:hypothetical protein
MDPSDLDAFCTDFFNTWEVLRSGTRPERVALERQTHASSAQFDALLDDDARLDTAWTIVLALVERAPDEEALSFVAAGPLEDLIRQYPASMADRVVAEARRNPRFRLALKGIWGLDTIPGPVGDRLTEVANESD